MRLKQPNQNLYFIQNNLTQRKDETGETSSHHYICTRCGATMQRPTLLSATGTWLIVLTFVLLFVALLWPIVFTALIACVLIFFVTLKKNCCPKCGGNECVVPINTPMGQKLLRDLAPPSPTVAVARKKVQLWEGGPYWAVTNIGADEPYEYGDYFWWGDTVGHKRVNGSWVASEGESSQFSLSEGELLEDKDPSSLLKEGWITADNVLAPEHDAAHVNWGDGWRMPTYQELQDLDSKCDWIWKTMNGVAGYVVRGRGTYASASIFLPAAGSGNWTSLCLTGTHGEYWASDAGWAEYYDYELSFDSRTHVAHIGYRSGRRPVRSVQALNDHISLAPIPLT